MAKLQTRNTVMAIKKEVTEGTPVLPSGATDFLALHEGFSFEPAFEELTNAELQSSIGATKNELGFENPTSSFDHYVRMSGVEGQKPNYSLLLESCLGAVVVEQAAERTLAAASTTSLLKLAAGGSDYAIGKAVLVKDPNGYSIRNVLSVATDDVTLAQNLSLAPAIGVTLGKHVFYDVANAGHATLSVWGYRANGGAVELISGSRVTELSISGNAGEYVTGSFSLEGIQYFLNPLTVTTSKWLDFSDSTPTVYAVSLTEKTYKDPYDLAEALQVAMNSVGSADSFTVSYSDVTSKYSIVSDGTVFEILWKTGVHGADGTDLSLAALLGYADAADDTAALTYASDVAQSWAAAFTPTYDAADALVAKANEIILGTSSEIACFGPQSMTVTVSNSKSNVLDMCASSGKSGSQFTGRTVTCDIVAYLEAGQVEEFKRYRKNDEIMLTWNFGEKSGGNWVAGKCMNLHFPTARISAFSLGDSDGIVTLEMTVQAFVKNGQSEFFINGL